MEQTKIQRKNRVLTDVCDFFESYAFIILLGCVVCLFYVLELPLLTLAICAACACFICFFGRDSRPALSVLMLTVFSLRIKDNPSAYGTPLAIVVYFAFGLPLLSGALYRLIKHRVRWTQKTGLLSIAFFCVAMLLGGVFTKYYKLAHFIYALGRSGILFGVYFFFVFTLRPRKDNLLYFARTCAVVICVIAVQILELYLRAYEWGAPMDSIWKQKIVLGWSISNIVAELIVFLIPTLFYLIYKEKKGAWYWIVVAVALIVIYFTLCRNALLWGGIVTVCGMIASCCIGANRRVNRIMILTLIGLGSIIIFVLYFLGYLDSMLAFFMQVKLDDRGRFNIWEKHLLYFTEYPLQGVGFMTYREIVNYRLTYAHNTLMQILGSTGLIGLIGYSLHRGQTIYILLKKPTADRLFIGSCVVVVILLSLLSPSFFYTYFMLYYSIILMLLEKSSEEEE